MSVATSISTTSLPNLIITVPDGMPAEGAQVNLTPWDELMGEDSLVGTSESDNGNTFKDIVEPGFVVLIYALLGITMVHRVIAFENHSNGSNKKTSV